MLWLHRHNKHSHSLAIGLRRPCAAKLRTWYTVDRFHLSWIGVFEFQTSVCCYESCAFFCNAASIRIGLNSLIPLCTMPADKRTGIVTIRSRPDDSDSALSADDGTQLGYYLHPTTTASSLLFAASSSTCSCYLNGFLHLSCSRCRLPEQCMPQRQPPIKARVPYVQQVCMN